MLRQQRDALQQQLQALQAKVAQATQDMTALRNESEFGAT